MNAWINECMNEWMKWILVNEMNFSDWNERNEFSIDFKHFQRFFIQAWQIDGQTNRASYRGAMAHLGIILAYFRIISSDFCFFSRFLTRAWPTDGQTDRISFRGAMGHFWIISSDFCFISRFLTRAWPTNRPTNRQTKRAVELRARDQKKQ